MLADCKHCQNGLIFDYETEAGEMFMRCTNFPHCHTFKKLAFPSGPADAAPAKPEPAPPE
ncbi:MAG: hypothetical protein IIB57_03595 [Planctomycetes bacterium]|nr:hypothetical protein [Planctomycetota bacterium]